MTEKKPLNFDFLDQNTKKIDEKVDVVVAPQPAPAAHAKVNFFRYLKECYTDFNGFCKKYLNSANPPYLIVLIWFFGMGSAADRLLGSLSNYSSWGEIWAVVIFGGIFAGALGYYIGGWWYNVRVGWSKGHENVNLSRNIYLFTSLPVSLSSILTLAVNQMVYGQGYLTYYYSNASTVDTVFALIYIAALIYTIRLSYKAVRETMLVEKKRAIWWFVVVPAVFYIILFSVSALSS